MRISNITNLLLFLLTTIIIIIIVASTSFASAFTTEQVEALLEFKAAAKCKYGMLDWKTSTPPCTYGTYTPTWSLIYCDNLTHITGLHLDGAAAIHNPVQSGGLECTGYLSGVLSKVQTITTIRLTPGIFGCTGWGSGTGAGTMAPSTLPAEWAQIPKLREIEISCQPNIYGQLPVEWGQMKYLNSLVLSHLGLNGTLQAEPLLSLNATLGALDLTNNKLEGDGEKDLNFLSEMNQLTQLSIASNRFSGRLNSNMSKMYNLQQLIISNNNWFSEIPQSWSKFNGLSDFDCSNNHGLFGKFFEDNEDFFVHLGPNFRYLDMHNCSFSGKITKNIRYFESLITLDLSQNLFSSTIPTDISKLVKVNSISLAQNDLYGELPEDFYKIAANLSSDNAARSSASLSLSYNRLTGEIDSKIFANQSRFDSFDFSYNKFYGNLPEITNVSCLQKLNFGHNFFTGELPPSWANISSSGTDNPFDCGFSFLDVSNNNLSGTLPVEWGNFGSRIEVFSVENNPLLGGTIPAEYGSFSRVKSLLLGNCDFVGMLPESFANLFMMAVLDVSGNCIEIDNTTLFYIASRNLSIFKPVFTYPYPIYQINFAPKCLDKISPPNTSVELSGVYSFSRTTHGGKMQGYQICDPLCYNLNNGNIRLEVFTADLEKLEFGVKTTKICSIANEQTDISSINFYDGCISQSVKLILECYYSPSEFLTISGVPNNKSNNNNNHEAYDRQYTISGLSPCDSQQQGFKFDVPPVPSWSNKTQLVQHLSDFVYFFSAADTRYLFGAYYRVRVDIGQNDYLGNHIKFENHFFTRLYSAPLSCHYSTVAVPLTTVCSPCPAHATCDGSVKMTVSTTPAWRLSIDALPFYPCPDSVKGCVSLTSAEEEKDDENNNNNINNDTNSDNDVDESNNSIQQPDTDLSGTTCRKGFAGFFCAACADGFGKVGAECFKCPPRGRQTIVLIFGIILVVLALGFLVYVSIDLSKHRDDAQTAFDRCFEENCSSLNSSLERFGIFFEKYKPLFERVVVTVRQLINHVSLLGALANTAAAVRLVSSVRRLLEAQQSANSFLLGSYATGLSCFATGSASTKTFEMMIDLYFIALILLSVLFMVWFRRLSVSVTVALFLSHIIYSPLTESCSRLLAICDQYVFYPARIHLLNPATYTGKIETKTIHLLSSDYSQQCDTGEFTKYRIGAGITLVFFSIGFPCVVVGIYKYLSFKQKFAFRDEVYTFLTQHYKSNCWWFEVVLMFRKLSVALIIGVLPNVSSLQLMLFAVLCAMMLAASIKYQPLTSETANTSDQLSISSALVCVALMSLANSFPNNEGVQIGVAVGIIMTQSVAILSISLFGGSNTESDEKLYAFFRDCCCSSSSSTGESGEGDYLVDRELGTDDAQDEDSNSKRLLASVNREDEDDRNEKSYNQALPSDNNKSGASIIVNVHQNNHDNDEEERKTCYGATSTTDHSDKTVAVENKQQEMKTETKQVDNQQQNQELEQKPTTMAEGEGEM